jgi:hypothetical protein
MRAFAGSTVVPRLFWDIKAEPWLVRAACPLFDGSMAEVGDQCHCLAGPFVFKGWRRGGGRDRRTGETLPPVCSNQDAVGLLAPRRAAPGKNVLEVFVS